MPVERCHEPLSEWFLEFAGFLSQCRSAVGAGQDDAAPVVGGVRAFDQAGRDQAIDQSTGVAAFGDQQRAEVTEGRRAFGVQDLKGLGLAAGDTQRPQCLVDLSVRFTCGRLESQSEPFDRIHPDSIMCYTIKCYST